MKLHLVCIGRLTETYLRDGCRLFADRIQHYLPLTITELKEVKTGRKPDRVRILTGEGEKLLQRTASGSVLVALDQRGRQFDSPGLADLLEHHMLDGTPEVTLAIGGPFGPSDAVRQQADRLLSLSMLTFTHQMARLILLEQIYRACTILRNEPYHH